MFVLFQFFIRVLSFAVFVTGASGLLNYFFDWHLSIEGTEAPAVLDGSAMLVCFSITLIMWAELAANNHYVVKFKKKWYATALYLLASILISAIPSYLVFKADEIYSNLYEALAENDIAEFQNKENLKNLSQRNLDRLFSESIRRNSPEIAQIISEFLKDVNGDPDYPYLFSAAYLCNPKIFEILIHIKTNFSVRDAYMGGTVLHSIVTGNGNIPDKSKVIRMLIEQKQIDINEIDNFQATPLMNAVERGEYELVETLLSLKADWRKVDHVGNPVLTRVCEKSSVYPALTEEDRIRTIQVLIKYGANKNTKDFLGRDCKELASENGFRKLVELF